MDWATTIRDARMAYGLKQSSLADLIGIDQATVSRWERGVSTPTVPFQRTTLNRITEMIPAAFALGKLRERVAVADTGSVLTSPGTFITDVCSKIAAATLLLPSGKGVMYDWEAAEKTAQQEKVFGSVTNNGKLFEDRTITHVEMAVSVLLSDGSVKFIHSVHSPVWFDGDKPRLLIGLKSSEEFYGQDGQLIVHRATEDEEILLIKNE